MRIVRKLVLVLGLLLAIASTAQASAPAGYSEYYIPGDEDNMNFILGDLDTAVPAPNTMHAIINVTAWSANTNVYYDHWEDGYDFDPANPAATADETVVLANAGDQKIFESSGMALPRSSATTYYDGGDRIYVAGGSVTVSRTSFVDGRGVGNQGVAWEIYPLQPQLTTYVLPFGENLGYADFSRVYVLIQATEDGTTFSVDLDGAGGPDILNQNRDDVWNNAGDSATVTLDRGETFLLDRISACRDHTTCTSATVTLNTGALIHGDKTLQVKFVAGAEDNLPWIARGFSVFPRGFWTKDYYAPLDDPTNTENTDYYLFNPSTTAAITVTWESRTASGSFSIPANSTVSFRAVPGGGAVPMDSGLYFKGSDVFWGVGSNNTAGTNTGYHEWGFSLLPSTMLYTEHYLGWAPGYDQTAGAQAVGEWDNVGVYVTPAQDNTRVFVDYNNDGAPDQTYNLDRLQTQFVYDTVDGDLSQAHIWATGEFSMAYGENSDLAPNQQYGMDIGYVAIPGSDFVSLVLAVDKTVSPQVVSTAASSQATFTIRVDSQNYTVDGVSVTDFLPPGWQYVVNSTEITLADLTPLSGAAAEPNNATPLNYRDHFAARVYTNNADNLPAGTNWTTNWIEDGEPASNPIADNVQVAQDGALATYALRFINNGDAVARMASLPSNTGVTLSFDYRRVLTASTQYVDVEVCSDATNAAPIACAAGWQTVGRINGSGAVTDLSYQHFRADLTSVLAATPTPSNFALRFSSIGSTAGAANYVWIDNVQVAADLTWPASMLGSMAENQEIIISFTAETTAVLAAGTISRNGVQAVGTRTFGSPSQTQTFTTTDFVYVASGDIEIDKSSSATDPLYPGDQFTYTVTVTNPATAAANFTGLSIYDPLPAGVSYVSGSSQVTGTLPRTYNVRHNFGTTNYAVNDGSVNWVGSWIESDAAQNATAGNVQITGGELRLGATSNIYRQVNLSSATAATLTMNYRTSGNIDANEWAYIEVATSDTPPGGIWTTVLSLENDPIGAGPWSINYTIPGALWSPTTTVRIRVAGYDANEYLYVDNVDVAYTANFSGTVAAGSAPNFVSDSDGFFLAPGATMTLTYNVTVDNPLAAGIEEITNTAYINSNEIILPLSASVTNLVVNPSSTSAAVGDRVWLDSDGDGALDLLEAGLANVEVKLKDQFGTPLMTTTTDATGHYLFTGIAAGTGYYVELTAATLPAGLQQSTPAGYTNRTAAFNLAAGQSYLDADIGYEPAAGTATIGMYVWSDANADNRRNPGEPGIAVVTVELWRDVDGDGLKGPGDTLCTVVACGVDGTTATAPDGSYLFSGVTAGGTQDYIVFVDETQTALSGYTRTSPPSGDALYSIIDLGSGASFLSANFGYQGTTYSITDRVWFDPANAGTLDSGEVGIGGVTVDLLDASHNAIATTTTAADGTFTFTGVAGGGADYTIMITDTDGILADYFGTTSYAQAGSRPVDNFTADLNYAATPSFGYNLSRAIGDTVFNDNGAGGGTAGNGSQDGGEPGLPGVTVRLYLDDGNGVFEPGAGDGAAVATLVTDVNGRYVFSGLSTATYWVQVDNSQAALTGYGLTTVHADLNAAGHWKVTMSGTNNLGIDYGYQAAAPRSVSGTLWEDINQDGVIDPGEARLPGVTIDLLDVGQNVIASATTGADGGYSFSGVPGGASYDVKITDAAVVLTGYTSTWEVTELLTGPFDGQETVDLSSSDATGVDFGYYTAIPTQVILAHFGAVARNGIVVVQWTTASERETLGFNLLRLDPVTGGYVRINPDLLPGVHKPHRGGRYSFKDPGASPGERYTYKLVEVEIFGREISYGPFTVVAGRFASTGRDAGAVGVDVSADSRFTFEERHQSDQRKLRMDARQSGLLADPRAAQGNRVKMTVTEPGLYYLSAREIASLLGMSPERAASLIGRGRLSLSNRGHHVAYLPAADNAGIYFYGVGLDSIYTKENVYWLDKALGTLMTVRQGAAPAPSAAENSFTETLHLEQDMVSWETLFDDPDADYWFWNQIFASAAYTDPARTFTFRPSGLDPAQITATLQAHLLGASDAGVANDHHVVVSVNGLSVEDRWSGLTPRTISGTFALQDGENTITVRGTADPGVSSSFVLIDSFDVTYQRRYEAEGDALFFRGDQALPVTVGGFSSPDIMVFDLTDPLRPQRDGAAAIGAAAGIFTVGVSPLAADTPYLAVAGGGVKPAAARAVTASRLASRLNWSDYVIIAPAELVDAARGLAAYRRGQGLLTKVVKLEDVMNEFNHGISSPEAIRAFLSFARSKWKRAPRYVVLAGDGSMDYKDNLGFGGNLVPSLLVPTDYGLAISDNRLADVKGDFLPEFAIGRLPVVSPEELQAVIAKIKTYERNRGNTNVVLVADFPDEGGDFIGGSAALATLFPAEYALNEIYLDDPDQLAQKREDLIGAINGGAGLVNFVGHAGPDQLSNWGLFSYYPYPEYDPPADDVALLTNATVLPVLTAQTCGLANFSDPYQDVLGEALLLKPDGGIAAAWSATGLSDDAEAGVLNRAFYKALLTKRKPVLGNVVRQALKEYQRQGASPFMIDIYTILGDPALKMR